MQDDSVHPPGIDHWRAVCRETDQHGSGRGRRKRTSTRGTSPAAYFTPWEPGGEIPPGYPTKVPGEFQI
jgi:hypothetical protein